MKSKMSKEERARMREDYKQDIRAVLYQYELSDEEVEDILENPRKHLENVGPNEDQKYVYLLMDLVKHYKQQKLPHGYGWY
ncbi:hypothetical protein ACLSYX_11115 [[Pasteurella] aerogenes]